MRATLRLSWLEVRPDRYLRRHAVGTRGHHAAEQSEAPRLPYRRKGRRGLDLYGSEGADPAGAGLRMDPRARKPPFRVQDIRELQLVPSAGRRPGHIPFILRAQQFWQ